MARRLGSALDLQYTEMDALFHGPGWTPRESFRADVDQFTTQSGWVTEFQYDQVRPMLVERADLMVWLDIPRRIVMWRVARRTVDAPATTGRALDVLRQHPGLVVVRLTGSTDVETWLRGPLSAVSAGDSP